jgi:ParB-like chromosome segregation protein Spo0J
MTNARLERVETGAVMNVPGGHDHGTAEARQSSFQPMPPLTTEEYVALRDDIAARGVLVPVIVDQHGRLIDGHHRRRAVQELGVTCPTEVRAVSSDHEAIDLAVTLNATRRHLSREQRRELIRTEITRRPEDSDRAIARRVGCSPSTVGAIRGGLRSRAEPHEVTPVVSNLDTSPESLRQQEAAIDKALADLDDILQAAIDTGMTPQHVIGLLLGMQREWRRNNDIDPEIVTAVERSMVQPRIEMLLDLAEPVTTGGDV